MGKPEAINHVLPIVRYRKSFLRRNFRESPLRHYKFGWLQGLRKLLKALVAEGGFEPPTFGL
jgi:hypothetical protein